MSYEVKMYEQFMNLLNARLVKNLFVVKCVSDAFLTAFVSVFAYAYA